MKKIEVTGSPLNVNGGKVKLSKEQASDRKSCLKLVKGGVYEVVKPIQFKIGEKFQMEVSESDETEDETTKEDEKKS